MTIYERLNGKREEEGQEADKGTAATAPSVAERQPAADAERQPKAEPAAELAELGDSPRHRANAEFLKAVENPEIRNDENRLFELCDKYWNANGLPTYRGNTLNKDGHQQYSSAIQYADDTARCIREGYKAIADPEYLRIMDVIDEGDDEKLAEALGIPMFEADKSDAQAMADTLPPREVRRSPEAIRADIDEKMRSVYAKNYKALYTYYRKFLDERGERILRDSIRNGTGLTLASQHEYELICATDRKQAKALGFLMQAAAVDIPDRLADLGAGLRDKIRGFFEGGYRALKRFNQIGAPEKQVRQEKEDYLRYINSLASYAEATAEDREKIVRMCIAAHEAEGLLSPEARKLERENTLALRRATEHQPYTGYNWFDRAWMEALQMPIYMVEVATAPGTAYNVFAHFDNVRDNIIEQGGNPFEAEMTRIVLSGIWAGIEKFMPDGFFGKSLTNLEKKVLMERAQQLGAAAIRAAKRKIFAGGLYEFSAKQITETLFEEAPQDALEAIETDLGLGKDGITMFKDAVEGYVKSAIESQGAIAPWSAIGTATAHHRIHRKMLDSEDVMTFKASVEKMNNQVRGEVVQDSHGAQTPERRAKREKAKMRRVGRYVQRAREIWDATETKAEAAAKIETDLALTPDAAEAMTDVFMMQDVILKDAEGNADRATAFRDAMIAHGIDPTLATFVAATDDSGKGAHYTAMPVENPITGEMSEIYDPVRHLQNVFKGAKVEPVTLAGDRPGDEPGTNPTHGVRVTFTVNDKDGKPTPVSFVAVERAPADVDALISTDSMAASVEHASGGKVTARQYLDLGPMEKRAVLAANGLATGGNFDITDTAGNLLFRADGIINLLRSADPVVHNGGNWTLTHETGHGVIRMARSLGAFGDDLGNIVNADGEMMPHPTVTLMRKLFGQAREGVDELWDEERMSDGLANYIGKALDGVRTDDVSGKTVWEGVFDFLGRMLHGFRRPEPGTAAAERDRMTKEQAREAVYEAIRKGDFAGLSPFADIKFDEEGENAPKTPSGASAQNADDERKALEERATAATDAKSGDSAAQPSENAEARAAEGRIRANKKAKNAELKGKTAGGNVPEDVNAKIDRLLDRIATLEQMIQSGFGGAVQAGLPKRTGRKATVWASPSIGVEVEYEIIDLDDIVDAYGDFQVRDRAGRVATLQQVYDNTRPGVWNPLLMFDSLFGDSGSPILVGGNLEIEGLAAGESVRNLNTSGNGRKLYLKQLLSEGRFESDYGKFRDQWCAEHGIAFDKSAYAHPVLVRRIVGGLKNRKQLVEFCDACNEGKMLELSEVEQALKDLKKLDPSIFRFYEGMRNGNLIDPDSKNFNGKFFEAFFDAVRSTGLKDKDGYPTDLAQRRMMNALTAYLFGIDEDTLPLVTSVLETKASLGLGRLYHALATNAASIIATDTDRRIKGYSIMRPVREAAKMYITWRYARRANPTLDFNSHLAQLGFSFEGEGATQTPTVVRELAKLLDAERFGSVLAEYRRLAAQQPSAQEIADSMGIITAYTPEQLLAIAERNLYKTGLVTPDPDSAELKATTPMDGNPPAEPAATASAATPITVPPPPPTPISRPTPPPAPSQRSASADPVATAQAVIDAAAENPEHYGEPVRRPIVKRPVPAGQRGFTEAFSQATGAAFHADSFLKLTVQKQLDRLGRLLGHPVRFVWAKGEDTKTIYSAIPKYLGYKKDMTTLAMNIIATHMTRAQREGITVTIDPFGGSGLWGITEGINTFPNSRDHYIGGIEEESVEKARLFLESDEDIGPRIWKFFSEEIGEELNRLAISGTARKVLKDLREKGDFLFDDLQAEAERLAREQSASAGTIVEALNEIVKHYRAGGDRADPVKAGFIGAVRDHIYGGMDRKAAFLNAKGEKDNLGKIKSICDELSEEWKLTREVGRAYQQSGGTFHFLTTDGYNGAAYPSGQNVFAFYDPPYYYTTGYDGKLVPIQFLDRMRDLAEYAIERRTNILYTDEAFALKDTYRNALRDGKIDTATRASEDADTQFFADNFTAYGPSRKVAQRTEVIGFNNGYEHDTASTAAETGSAGIQRNDEGAANGTRDGAPGAGESPAAADGSRSSVYRQRPLRGLAGEGQGADEGNRRGVYPGGGRSGQGERIPGPGTVALAREVIVADIAASLSGSEGVAPRADRLARHSVRLVREERMADYARLVSKNARRWLATARKRLDEHMAAHGYTEKVWHGTNGEDFNVFKFSADSHDVHAAYFTYSQGTAQNYAALRAEDEEDPNRKPNTRQFYVNPGKTLDLDETANPTTLDAFIAKLADAYRQGYNAVRVHGALDDMGWRLDENDEQTILPSDEVSDEVNENGGIPTDILIVLQQPGDNAPARIKAADPVTFIEDTDGSLPIPLEMRADQSLADVRFSVTMGKRAREEARAMIEKYRHELADEKGLADGAPSPSVETAIDQIAAFDTPKERKAALYWFCKATVRLPEDAPKVRDALKTAERAHVDPFQFDRPGAILEQYSEFVPKEPPINPDTVPELSDRRDMGNGIVTYLVQDDRQGQAAMRRIINTHFGRDASPWCLLQGDGNGNLSDSAWGYWNHYNALPKRVAFQNGKLVAFMATDEGDYTHELGFYVKAREQWWDRADEPHEGIPFTRSVPSPSGEGASATEHCELAPDGTVTTTKVTRGNPKAPTGTYEEWNDEGWYRRYDRKNDNCVHFEVWRNDEQFVETSKLFDGDVEIADIRIEKDMNGNYTRCSASPHAWLTTEFPQVVGTSNSEGFDTSIDGEYYDFFNPAYIAQMCDKLFKAISENNQEEAYRITNGLKTAAESRAAARFSVQRTTRLAPNGKRSNLTDRQYDQVRTPEFKAWFGDWEAAAVRTFLDTEIVATANGDEYLGLGRKEITNAVFENWQRVGGRVTNPQVGDILLSKSGIHDSLAHGFGRAKIAAFNLVPEILSKGRVVRFRQNWEGRGYDSHVIAAPVMIGGRRHVALAIVNSNKGGNRFYLHEVGLLDEIRKSAEALRTGSSGETPALSRNLGDVSSIALSLFESQGVSRVVDENGEPLVVYRGASFDPLKQPVGKGIVKPEAYFSPSEEYAKRYGDTNAYFLNIRNPYDIRRDECEADFHSVYPSQNPQRGISGALDWAEASTIDGEFLEENFPGKYDGVVYDEASDWGLDGDTKWRGNSYVPLNGGSQVKSATDNTGAFSPDNPDIRFSVVANRDEAARKFPNTKYVDADGKFDTSAYTQMKNAAIARLAGVRGSATSVAVAPATETPAQRTAMRNSVFVGKHAALKRAVDFTTLGEAMSMLGSDFGGDYNGDARGTIYIATGWWKGTDGLWRFEISDLKPNETVGVTGKPDGKNGLRYKTVNGLAYRTDCDYPRCHLTDLVSHPKLFKAYPELKSTVVQIGGFMLGEFGGRQYDDDNLIVIGKGCVERINRRLSNVLTVEGLQTLTHEVQHVVQTIEGFAPGGNASYHGPRNYQRLAGEVEARNAERRLGYGQGGRTPHGGYEAWRERMLNANDAPWETEDVPTAKQIIADDEGNMRDIHGRPVRRHSVIRRVRPIPEEGTKRSDAVKSLNSLKGNEFTNAETGITARLSSTGTGKLISNAAVAKTMANGFTADQHNAMAARIDELFVNATLTEDRPDRYGDVNVKSIKRFVCPVQVGATDAGAYITVKESVEHGNRIYSVEGIKMAALSPTVRRAIADRNSADNAASDARNIPYSASERQARPSVIRRKTLHSTEDIAVGYLAQRQLAGKENDPQDVQKLLRSLGIDNVNAADAIDKASAIAARHKAEAVAKENAADPTLMTSLASEAMRNRVSERILSAYATGAADMDPELARRMQDAIARRDRRMLDSVTGYTAAEIQNELFIDPSAALLITAEYEKTPEEKARIEAERQKREEERKRRDEAGEAEDQPEDESDARPEPMEVPGDRKALVDELLAAAASRQRADEIENLRKKLEAKRKAEEKALADGEDENEGGNDGEGGGEPSANDFDIVAFNLIKPIFTSNDNFAYFLMELMMRKLAVKYPELGATDEMWKNPIAVKELQKTAQHILAKMAHDTLGISMSRAIAMMDIAKITQYKKLESTRRWIAHVYGRIHEDALRLNRRQLVTDLIRGNRTKGLLGLRQYATTRGRFSSTREDLKRKIDAKTELFCRRLIPYLTMSEEKLEEEITYLKGRIAELEAEANDTGSSADNDSHYIEARDKLMLAEKYGGMIRKMPAEIIRQSDEIRAMLDGRRQEFELRREERKEQDAALRNALIAAMSHTDKKEHRLLNVPGLGLLANVADSLVGNLDIELRSCIRYCTNPVVRQQALDAIDEVMFIVSRGTEQYNTARMNGNAEVNANLVACYGTADKGLQHLNEELPEEIATRYFKQKPRSVFKPTYAHLLQLYASCIQYDYAENVKTHGRADQISAMAADLAAEDLAFHAATVNWYAQNRQALSDANEEITGLPVETPDRLYVPVRTKNFKEGYNRNAKCWGPVPSALTRRTKHEKDFNESVSFLDMIDTAIEVRAQLIGYGMAGIRLRDILSTVDMREAADRHGVRKELERAIDHVQDVLMQGMVRKVTTPMDRMINWGRRKVAVTALAGNVIPAIKQLASMPVWANLDDVGFRNQLHYLTSIDTDALDALKKSDGYRTRYILGWSEETANILRNPSKNWLGRINQKRMRINSAFDKVSCLWMGQGYYRQMLAKLIDRGLDEEEAKRRAATMTWARCEQGQQSGRIENMNWMQRNKGEFAGALFQFLTAPLLQANYEYNAIREVAAGTPGAKGRLIRALVINHILVPGFMQAINLLFKCVCGQPPDDDDELKAFFTETGWQMLLGSFSPLFIAPRIGESLYNMATGRKEQYHKRRSTPAEQAFDMLTDGAKLAVDLGKYGIHECTGTEFDEEVTIEKLQKEMDRMAKTLIPEYRIGKKIYDGWKAR